MRCRTGLSLALGLVVGLTGCSKNLSGGRLFGGKKPDEDVVHKPSTYIAFADYRAQVGFAKELSHEAQLQYREEARLSYLKAIDGDAKSLPAHLGLARLLTNWERHAEAVSAYDKALELSPSDAGLWYEKGTCQGRAKNWAGAAESFARATELAPQQARFRSHLGLALARGGRLDEGLAHLSRAVGEAQAHYDLARLLAHQNQPRLAQYHAAEALRRDPNLAGARALLAPPASPPPAPRPEVRTVSHEAPVNAPPPQIITPNGGTPPAPLAPALIEGATSPPPGPINVPPRPVISIRSR